MSYILDTNIITAILKEDKKVLDKIRELRFQNKEIFISGMTYYEVQRGLLAVNTTRKLYNFNQLCYLDFTILFLPDIEIIQKAAEIYADLKRQGTPVQTVDIFIAATAIIHDLIVVSHDSDMRRINGITVEDWLIK